MVRDIAPLDRPYLLSPAQLRRSLHVDAPELAMARVWHDLRGYSVRVLLLLHAYSQRAACNARVCPKVLRVDQRSVYVWYY